MIKRVMKRSLSIFLTLVLLATTFFIFDPSVLKMDASAWLDVENLEQSGRPEVEFLVPETIYVDQNNKFKYYVDSDVNGGLSRDPAKTTGQIYFECSDSCSSISITPSVETGSAASYKYNIYGGSSGVTTCSKANAASLNAQLVDGIGTSGTIIKWTAQYTTARDTFYSYAYTYVYQVSSDVMGSGYSGTANGTFANGDFCVLGLSTGWHSVAKNNQYTFLPTGEYHPMNMAIGIADYSEEDFGGSNGGGHGKISSGYDIYMYSVDMDDYHPKDAGFDLLLGGRTNTAGTGGSINYFGYSDSHGTKTQSGTKPTASITVDKSRYTNTNQIPYLQTVEYWAHTDWTDGVDMTFYYGINGGAFASYYNSPDLTKNDGGNRTKYCSLRIDSPIQASNYTLNLYEKGYYDYNGNGSHEFNVNMYQDVAVTVVDKATLRATYRQGCNNAYTSSEVSAHASDIANLKAMGTNLGNPTSTTTTTYTVPQLPSLGDKVINAPKVTFYVPETIYLKPVNGNMNTFQYYVDRANSENGALRKGEQTSGNVYFNCSEATSVTIKCEGATINGVASGSNSFSGTTSVSGSITSGTLSTAISQNTYSTLTWTATYVAGGKTYTVKAYTRAYAPYLYAAACEVARKRADFWVSASDRDMANGTLWISGIQSVSANGNPERDANGSFNHFPLAETWNLGNAGNSGKATTTSCGDNNNKPTTENDLRYTSSGEGYTGYWTLSADSGTATIIGHWDGNITVDTSRGYTNLNEIPNLRVGVDVQEQWNAKENGGGYVNISSGGTSIIASGTGVPNKKQNWQGYRFGARPNTSLTNTPSSVQMIATIHARVSDANPVVNLLITYVNKTDLRNAINAELAIGRQEGWYTEGWSTYSSKMKTAMETLGDLTATASAINNARTGIADGVAALKNTTEYTALAHHKSNASGNKLLQDEQIKYHRGDNVTAGSNTYTGYTYASVTAPSGVPATDPSVAKNTESTNLEWTFWYTPKTYNVVYKKNDATGGITADTTKTATYDATFTVGNGVGVPTKTGATFAGWEFSGNGNTYQMSNTFTWQYDDNSLYFTPTWTGHKYNIAFNANNGTGSIATMEGCEYGKTYTLPDATAYLSRAGYDFAGWAETSTATVAKYANKASVSNLTPTNDATVTLFAVWTPRTYTVTLHPMTENLDGTFSESTTGGTVSGGGTKNYGAALSITKTAKTGFTAASSWYSNANLSSAVTPPSTVTGDLEYWAKFTRKKYTINFNYNYTGQTTPYRTLSNVKYGSYQEVANPTRDGYVFIGWYTEASCTNSISFNSTSFTVGDLGNDGATVNYYAKWLANTIGVAYNAGAGSGTAPENDAFSYGASYTTKGANTFTAPAAKTVTFNATANGGTCATASLNSTYSFDKWLSSANNETYAASTATSDSLGATSGTVTLTAQWKQNSITLPSATKTGYTFAGWYTAQTGGSKVGGAGSTYTPTAATTPLYAQFTAVDYTVTVGAYYNTIAATTTYSSGTTGGTVTGGGTYHYGDSLSGVKATPATGYKFDGWYTDSTFATSTSVPSIPSTMPDSNKTYIAKFSIDYCTVKAYAYSNTASGLTTWANNATGGTVKVAAATTGSAAAASEGKVITGNSATLTATAATGYHFVGWYSAAPSGATWGTAASSTDSLSVAYTSYGATVNKYARFDINTNTLKVIPNGGTWNGSTSDQSTTKAGGQTLSIPVPTKTGYTFTGWTKSSTFNGSITSTTAAATYTFPNTVYGQTDTLTAGWSAITYTIAFNKNNTSATGSTASVTNCKYDTNYTLTSNGFTLTGYDFNGWNTKADGTGTSYANNASVKNLTATNGATVTLYAQWKIKSYTVTLTPYANNDTNPTTWSTANNGGSVSGAGTFNYGAALSISATPATGYTFDGWYTAAPTGGTTWDDSKKVTNPATTMGAANITYYAKFSIKSFTVTAKAVADTAADTALKEVYASNAGCTATPATSTVYYNKNASLTAAAGTGYTFAGWFDNEACTGTALSTSATYTPAITANKTFYAKFTVIKTKVNVYAYSNTSGSYTQNTTGGTVTVEGVSPVISADQSITMGYNGSYKVTATPATGYTFDGWFTNSALTAAATGATATTATTATFTKKNADENIYAKFTISTPKLTVYAYNNTAASTANYTNGTVGGTVAINSGTAGKTATADINYNTQATIKATPATGYNFDGWYSTVTGGSGSAITAWVTQFSTAAQTNSDAMTAARTYYAKFSIKSITITFNANGGTGGTTTVTAYYGTPVTAPTTTRQGYKLSGWDTSSTATSATYSATSINADALVLAGTNTTLYAVWQEFNYTIYLAAANDTANNIGTFTVGTAGGTIAYKSGVTKINVGDKIVDCLDITPNAGYELVDVVYRTVTSAPSSGSNVTSWKNSPYSVNTSGYENMVEFPDNSKIAIIAYFQVCTFTAKAFAYSNKSTSPSYTNTAAGGTVKAGQTGAPGATATESGYFGNTNGITFYATAKTGYTFDGWYKDAALTTLDTTNASVKVILGDDRIDANVNNRYAKFSINVHNAYARAKYYTDGFDNATGAGSNGIKGGTVTVSASSGTATTTDNNAVSVQAKYTEFVTYTAEKATGYEFAGWYVCDDTSDDVNIKEEEAIETDEEYVIVMADADIRIHGKFVPINFVVTLNPNGGTAGPTAEVTLTYNKGITLDSSAKPTRPSYNFIGWSELNNATAATYNHTGSNCTINVDVVNRWYNDGVTSIYAVWEIAKYIVMFDDQGGSGGPKQVEVTLNEAMPTITDIPTYEGYSFSGYYTEAGGADETTKYYNADGTSAKAWDIADGGTLYAKWVCPVLKDAIFDESTGEWTYVYEDTTGADTEADPTDAILTKQGLSDNAPTDAKQITSIDTPNTKYVEEKVKATEDINLNHYTEDALKELYTNVIATNTDLKRGDLSQIELNEYVAKLARYTDINAPKNKKDTETFKPTVKLYETKDKVKAIKNETLTKDLSVTGDNYSKPSSNDAASFVYTNKWSNYKSAAVDYYIYTNSRTPVIALEIDDGDVGATVAKNSASYPTNANIVAEGSSAVVADKDGSYMHSAVPATDDINNAWFSRYTKANIGTKYDYNAKEIIYLTPSFTPTSATSTTDEIVYTITPSDDATTPNAGLQKAQIAEIPSAQSGSFKSFGDSECPTDKNSITVCVCYHNAMNGTNEEGGELGDPYFQLYIDQVDLNEHYADIWLNQMHIFRQSGGANNWEVIMADETIYPVEDETYKDTGYVLGSFAYVFDATNEPTAMSYAEAGNYEAAKKEIIKSIKSNPTNVQEAILNTSHSDHITKDGVGFFDLDVWNTNFYPKHGTYVYAHAVDRWGNYFNRVWKCFNVDEYTAVITGTTSTGFTVTEDGGSNIATISIDCDEINLATDIDSSFEDNIFITSGNQFTIMTGKPKTKLAFSVVDNAGNEKKGNIPTDLEGNVTLTINDLCADLSSGAYTFMLNDTKMNLYACPPAVVRDASMPEIVISGEPTVVTVKTSADAYKVQLDENGETRTYTEDSEKVTVVDNGDGTKTWSITVMNISIGEHSYDVKGKNGEGWHDSEFTLKTTAISKPAPIDENALISINKPITNVREKAVFKFETKAGTGGIRILYDPTGYTKTVYRDENIIETTEDGNEIWTITALEFAAPGTYDMYAYAMYNGKWQKTAPVTSIIKVVDKNVLDAVIYKVDFPNGDVKRYTDATFVVETNVQTTKLQLLYSGTSKTFTSANAQVIANSTGTLTWIINKSFTSSGNVDISFMAKSSTGWTPEEYFGTITVVK